MLVSRVEIKDGRCKAPARENGRDVGLWWIGASQVGLDGLTLPSNRWEATAEARGGVAAVAQLAFWFVDF